MRRTPEQWAKELDRRSKLSNFSGKQAQAEITALIREVIAEERKRPVKGPWYDKMAARIARMSPAERLRGQARARTK